MDEVPARPPHSTGHALNKERWLGSGAGQADPAADLADAAAEPEISGPAEPAAEDSLAGTPAPPDHTPRQIAILAPFAALTLLTIIPVARAIQGQIGVREVRASAPWFPVVGALLGLLIAVPAYELELHSNGLLGGAVVAVAIAILTGALHLDGLADSADALGARGGSIERRLEIMRDASTGAYGTVAIVGWFVIVGAAVGSLVPGQLIYTVVLVLSLARVAAVRHAHLVEQARHSGLGAGFFTTGGQVSAAFVLPALLIAAAFVLPTGGFMKVGVPTLTCVGAIGLTFVFASTLLNAGARRLVGGRTGDTFGATIAITEALCLLAAAATATLH